MYNKFYKFWGLLQKYQFQALNVIKSGPFFIISIDDGWIEGERKLF